MTAEQRSMVYSRYMFSDPYKQSGYRSRTVARLAYYNSTKQPAKAKVAREFLAIFDRVDQHDV